MNCPYCNGPAQVIQTEKDIDVVIRKKRCKVCNSRFYTQEIDIDINKGKALFNEIHKKNFKDNS